MQNGTPVYPQALILCQTSGKAQVWTAQHINTRLWTRRQPQTNTATPNHSHVYNISSTIWRISIKCGDAGWKMHSRHFVLVGLWRLNNINSKFGLVALLVWLIWQKESHTCIEATNASTASNVCVALHGRHCHNKWQVTDKPLQTATSQRQMTRSTDPNYNPHPRSTICSRSPQKLTVFFVHSDRAQRQYVAPTVSSFAHLHERAYNNPKNWWWKWTKSSWLTGCGRTTNQWDFVHHCNPGCFNNSLSTESRNDH